MKTLKTVVKLSQTVSMNLDNGFVYWNEEPKVSIRLTDQEKRIMTFLCKQYHNERDGQVSNREIFEFVYGYSYNSDEDDIKHITRAVSKLRGKETKQFSMYDIIESDNRGNFRINLPESPFVENESPSPVSKTNSDALSEYAKHINIPSIPSEFTDAQTIFSFRNSKISFRGRDNEIRQLEEWLGQGSVTVWGITGQGGSGKSRLALHFALKMEKEKKAKAVWLYKKEALEKLLKFDDYSYTLPVLFICDYAAQLGDQLIELIDKMSRAQTRAGFLLLERSDVWYRDFLQKNDAVKERAEKKPIILDSLEFSPKEYAGIMQDFSDALYGKGKKKIPEEAQEQIVQKAKELSGKKSAARCLILLHVTDAYLKDADIRRLNAQNLLHNYLEHSREILKKHYDEDLISDGYHVLAYATACNGIRFSDMQNHPAVQIEWETIKKQFKGRQQINQYFQRMSEIEDKDIVPAMKPDLIGEFLFLHTWNDLMDEQADWLSDLLKIDYCRIFFAMCLTDWSEESNTLCEMLSDRSADAGQRSDCAKVFNRAVREMQTEEERKEYAMKIKELDYDYSAAILKEYTGAIRFIFEHATKDTRAECMLILRKVKWEEYSNQTKKEQQHLAEAYNNIAGIYQNMNDYDNALKYFNMAMTIIKNVLDKEHPYIAMIYNNIALVYQAKGDYDNALVYFNKALAIKEKVYDMGHLSTAITYNNVASAYRAMGDYDKALEFNQKAQAIREKVLRKEQRSIIKVYNNTSTENIKRFGDFDDFEYC